MRAIDVRIGYNNDRFAEVETSKAYKIVLRTVLLRRHGVWVCFRRKLDEDADSHYTGIDILLTSAIHPKIERTGRTIACPTGCS